MDETSVRKAFADFDGKIDVIIDDGDHVDQSQLATLRNFWPLLRDGGLYIIEDIYPGSRLSTEPRVIENVVGSDVPFFFVGVKNNLCVLQKTRLSSRRAGY